MRHQKLETITEIFKRMAYIKLKGGEAETLWHNNIRYRKNYKKPPSSPDIVIFIDGEFWHNEDLKDRKTRLKKNREYWIEKTKENMALDKRNDALLIDLNWTPIHFWEKRLLENPAHCISKVLVFWRKNRYNFYYLSLEKHIKNFEAILVF